MSERRDLSLPHIIGGMFGLEDGLKDPRSTRSVLLEPNVRLATGRSALTLLCRFLRPRQVWLPSYLCDVVLGAFAGGTHVRFYPVDERLDFPDRQWLREVQPGDMTVFIDYFGFNRWAELGAEARQRDAWVVEDACQALLAPRFCEHAHYVVLSPRKFVGVPDGGILLAPGGASLPPCELAPPPADWWLASLLASRLRAEFDRQGGERTWFELFTRTDAAGPSEPTAMSELSALLLDHRIDYEEIARARRRNYQFLAAKLRHLAMFTDLPSDVVPLGFPIRLRERDRVRRALFAADIYPPVHWSIEDSVPLEFGKSHQLAAEIMTLPCDQRYDEDDMYRMVACLEAASPKAVCD